MGQDEKWRSRFDFATSNLYDGTLNLRSLVEGYDGPRLRREERDGATARCDFNESRSGQPKGKMTSMIEQVVHGSLLHAVIIRRDFRAPGAHFVTPGEFSQQLAYMNRPAGHTIPPHFHRDVQRDVHRTLEVLVIRSGRLRVHFFNDARVCFGSSVLEAGDAILLAYGGHSFDVLEDCEMFEVKQGPYLGDEDKVHFTPAVGPDSRQP